MSEDPETINRILKGIKKKYDKDKEGWKVMGGRNREFSDLIISQNPYLWYLKSKTIDPYRAISYGKELRNIDADIAVETGKKKFDAKEVFHSLFGMSVPISNKDIITAAGIQRIAPKEMRVLKKRIDEKFPNINKNLEKKVRKTWKSQYPDRDNVYL